ncbi:YVTN repeat-like/Quino protein amine dehydrogenase [Coniophora puteana RWD-64-598 SS2]|uniref:YVTN repeat-like/Quino protein amine dehydrogenase n=1 Tax=Coniophora puteana (strain RWD-64-598) TaxID=741705 RepID=A0A5M3M9A0_CONPW|nr:YVTN repeat-like/Quino protein amine dehydrogenase [Coniophora puteana RWD-64-598 SS2]EIW75808.1 YVTN repeat-like/Quino protein amine dehydrogenase [Coniophora puteana RWD-64-598 SS2]
MSQQVATYICNNFTPFSFAETLSAAQVSRDEAWDFGFRPNTDAQEVKFLLSAAHSLSQSSPPTTTQHSMKDTILKPFTGHTNHICTLSYSPCGAFIATGSVDSTIRIWEAKTGRQAGDTLEGHTGQIHALAYSPDGRYLASASDDKTLRIWDTNTYQTVARLLDDPPNCVQAVQYSLDGKLIATGGRDNLLKVWSTHTLDCATELWHPMSVNSVSFSPSSEHVATACHDSFVRIYDVAQKEVIHTLSGHQGSVRCVQYSPDGKVIASASDDLTVRLWNASTGDMIKGFLRGHTSSVSCIAFTCDSRQLIGSSEDGTIRACGDDGGTLRIWDIITRQTIMGPLQGHTDGVQSVEYSPDGSRSLVASAGDDRVLKLWDARTGSSTATLKHPEAVRSVSFSPNGKRIATACDDWLVRVYDVDEQQLVFMLTGHQDCVRCVQHSPDGYLIASASDDHTIRLWSASAGHLLASLRGHEYSVSGLSFSHYGWQLDEEDIEVNTLISLEVPSLRFPVSLDQDAGSVTREAIHTLQESRLAAPPHTLTNLHTLQKSPTLTSQESLIESEIAADDEGRGQESRSNPQVSGSNDSLESFMNRPAVITNRNQDMNGFFAEVDIDGNARRPRSPEDTAKKTVDDPERTTPIITTFNLLLKNVILRSNKKDKSESDVSASGDHSFALQDQANKAVETVKKTWARAASAWERADATRKDGPAGSQSHSKNPARQASRVRAIIFPGYARPRNVAAREDNGRRHRGVRTQTNVEDTDTESDSSHLTDTGEGDQRIVEERENPSSHADGRPERPIDVTGTPSSAARLEESFYPNGLVLGCCICFLRRPTKSRSTRMSAEPTGAAGQSLAHVPERMQPASA